MSRFDVKKYYSLRTDKKNRPYTYRIREETHSKNLQTNIVTKKSKTIENFKADKEAAKKRIIELRAELNKENNTIINDEKITLKKLSAEFINNKSKSGNWSIAHKTDCERYGKYLKAFLGEEKDIKDITKIDLENFINFHCYDSENKKVLKDNTINQYITFIKSILNYAFDNEYIKKNPAKSINKVKIKDQVSRIYLRKEDLGKLLEYCKTNYKWFYNILIVGLYTGMRRGELCKLSFDWVDFDKALIIIPEGATKAHKQREINFSNEVEEVLLKCRNMPRNSNEKIVFLNSVGEPIKKDNITHTFVKIKKLINLPEGITFHGIRSTFITNCFDNRANAVAVQALVGHQDLKTTQRYASATSEMKKKVIDELKIDI